MPEIVALPRIGLKVVELAIIIVEINDKLPIAAAAHDDELRPCLDVVAGDLCINRVAWRKSLIVFERPPQRPRLEVGRDRQLGRLEYGRRDIDQLDEVSAEPARYQKVF